MQVCYTIGYIKALYVNILFIFLAIRLYVIALRVPGLGLISSMRFDDRYDIQSIKSA